MKIERIKHLITNLLTGSSSTSERAELAKWMNSEEAERNSREAWESASEDIDESLKSEIWNDIQLKIKGAVSSKPVSSKHITKRRIYSIPRVAATIAIIAQHLLHTYYTIILQNIKRVWRVTSILLKWNPAKREACA